MEYQIEMHLQKVNNYLLRARCASGRPRCWVVLLPGCVPYSLVGRLLLRILGYRLGINALCCLLCKYTNGNLFILVRLLYQFV